MPFHKNIIIDDYTKIKIWKVIIGENKNIELDEYDNNLLKLKKKPLSKEHFLATRKILEHVNPNYKIRYDKAGKPSINSKSNISISHSYNIVAVVFSNNCKIGLDIQLKNIKILNIQNKFLNKSEKLTSKNRLDIDYLTQIWTAKESIYKALGIKGISFSENIIIKKTSNNKGQGYYINGKEMDKFDLNFFYIDDYVICYAHQV